VVDLMKDIFPDDPVYQAILRDNAAEAIRTAHRP
jgi:hypothetical protein